MGAWYRQNMGIDQIPVKLEEKAPPKFVQQIPPPTGYGTEEDSLGSVYSLDPKPPGKDVNKMLQEDKYILRYECRLLSEVKDSNAKSFILSFFCGDDTILITETSKRNSGVWAGKFLERGRYFNPETGK